MDIALQEFPDALVGDASRLINQAIPAVEVDLGLAPSPPSPA
jgi:hypothetical protein